MRKLIGILMIIALLIGCKEQVYDQSAEGGNLKSAKIVPADILIVLYREQKPHDSYGQVKKQVGIMTVLKVNNAQETLEKMMKDDNVIWAEQNSQVMLDVVNDSVYNSGTLWNMYSDVTLPKNEFGCHAIEQWDKGNTGNKDLYVAIIDQGYMLNHPDLVANVGTNPFDIPNNNIDDENNGYIDDVYGWDFYNNDNTIFDGSGDYHGTHVAGIIGASGNNGIGVAGVVWDVKFISIKAFGYYGAFMDDLLSSIYYMIDLKDRGLNIVAANCSWGSADRSRALTQAFSDAEDAGILMVCSAGNAGSSKPRFPASFRMRNIISVASIDKAGHLSVWSSYDRQNVDLAAPGQDIVSTYPQSNYLYTAMSGTSMAAPHVTGACLLYKSLHTNATWPEIKAGILSNVIETPSLDGKVATGGRLDVSNY